MEPLDVKFGGPGPEILKRLSPLLAEATHCLLQGDFLNFLQYGENAGEKAFTSALADFLTAEYEETIESSELLVTSGATSGLWLLVSNFATRGSPVFVEDPTYHLALDIFRDFGLNIIPVERAEEGHLATDLEWKLQSHRHQLGGDGEFSALVYLIPTFNNPTGLSLGPDDCRRLASLTRTYNLLTICDDVYNLLSYTGPAPSRLRSFSRKNGAGGAVVSNGSFSKVLGPGLRLGWIETDPDFIHRLSRLGVVHSGGALNNYTSGLVTQLITHRLLQPHISSLRDTLGSRMSKMADLLSTVPRCKLLSPNKGGYFLWLQLPPGMEASTLQHRCCHLVTFQEGQRFSPRGKFRDCIRISISFLPEEKIPEAFQRLANAIQLLDQEMA